MKKQFLRSKHNIKCIFFFLISVTTVQSETSVEQQQQMSRSNNGLVSLFSHLCVW